jgi:hypothetical protein
LGGDEMLGANGILQQHERTRPRWAGPCGTATCCAAW